ncbi:MAG: hypothetical protein RIS70_4424 [Planctomycetota bacterium]|jgi:hypothetical protein
MQREIKFARMQLAYSTDSLTHASNSKKVPRVLVSLCENALNDDRPFHASKSLTTVAPVTSGSVSRSGRPLWR